MGTVGGMVEVVDTEETTTGIGRREMAAVEEATATRRR
jgi:hypothetical protein